MTRSCLSAYGNQSRVAWALGLGCAMLLGSMSTTGFAATQSNAAPSVQDLNELALDLFKSSGSSGMLIVEVSKGKVRVIGMGRQGDDDLRTPSGTTLLRIGSLSKLLTGEVLAHLAFVREISLNDSLQLYAPADHSVPGGDAITLKELASHTSSLPREAPKDHSDDAPPFTRPTQEQRWAEIRNIHITSKPGTSALYSNLAYDLLGDAMASATRRPYATLLGDFVTGPLDMKDTTATPNSSQCQRLMRTSQTGICSDTSATQASGGLYSTANDMARWMQAMLSPRRNASERLAMRMLVRRDRLSTIDGLDIAGHVDAIGMAWLQQDATGQHPRIIQKTGGGGGFMSYIALAPDRNEGIFVCFDRVDIEALRKVTQLANSFLAKGSQ